MFLRAFLAKHFASSALLVFVSLGCAAYVGCSSGDAQLTCDPEGQTCVCDANGCKPADPSVSSSSSSGDTSSSSSSSSSSSGESSSSSSSSSSSGGKPPCDPTNATCGCTTTADCMSPLLCIEGLCIVGCNNSFECGGGKVCVNGKCEVGCSDQKPCVAGEKCVNGYCLPDSTNPECTTNAQCQSGQTCVGGICEVFCLANTDCPAGQVCDYTNGGCIPNPSPIPSCGPNKPCPGTAQCGPQGYCQYQCTDLTACKLIDSRFTVCDQNICKTPEETNPQCNLQKPCPVGQDCVSNKCL